MRTLPLSRLLAALLLAGCVLSTGKHAAAQDGVERTGTVYLADWPSDDALADPDQFDTVDLLPLLDTLALSYTYTAGGTRPDLRFSLEWLPGDAGILDGRRVSAAALPSDIRLTRIDLEVDIYLGDMQLSTLALTVDSTDLAPRPARFPFELVDVAWADVFPGISASGAQQAFAEGFTLRNLSIIRIAFAAYPEMAEADRTVDVRPRPRPPVRTGVYVPRPTIWVIWGRDPYRTPPRTRRSPERPRDDEAGRDRDAGDSSTDRSSPRAEDAADEDRSGDRGLGRLLGGSRDDDDEDEDDDTQLLPVAIAGAAALGVAAFAGGTIGYFGDAAHAPIGLASGYVAGRGGFLLRLAVNDAVLGARGRERLVAQTFSFYDAFQSPVQPALGLGVWAEEDGDTFELRPSVTLGAVVRIEAFILQVTYDVAQPGLQLGLAYNFRAHR